MNSELLALPKLQDQGARRKKYSSYVDDEATQRLEFLDRILALRVQIAGLIQGVGFRSYVFNLASIKNIKGWARLEGSHWVLHLQGSASQVLDFLRHLNSNPPKNSKFNSIKKNVVPFIETNEFVILNSINDGKNLELNLPTDLNTCKECLNEFFDSTNRRYLYPFISCAQCGPKYTIIKNAPFDRENTSFSNFKICNTCKHEYSNPVNRRFLHQTISCHECGPQIYSNSFHWKNVVNILKKNELLIIKSVGGYFLLGLAQSKSVVEEIRKLKGSPKLPLTLMVPSLAMVSEYFHTSLYEMEELSSQKGPIVNLKIRKIINSDISMGSKYTGVLLPHTPIFHWIAKSLQLPLILTPACSKDEPIPFKKEKINDSIIDKIYGIIDNDLDIVNSIEDTQVSIASSERIIFKSGRGYFPITKYCDKSLKVPTLGFGTHAHASLSVHSGDGIYMGPELGSLSSTKVLKQHRHQQLFLKKILNLDKNIYSISNQSSKNLASVEAFNQNLDRNIVFPNHLSHLYSILLEFPNISEGLCFFGDDSSSKHENLGGELIYFSKDDLPKVAARIRPFSIPAYDYSLKYPPYLLIGLLYSYLGDGAWQALRSIGIEFKNNIEKRLIKKYLNDHSHTFFSNNLGNILTSCAGALGFHSEITYDREAEVFIQELAEESNTRESYSFEIHSNRKSPLDISLRPFIFQLINDIGLKKEPEYISKKIHNFLIDIIVKTSMLLNFKNLFFTGGFFQNGLIVKLLKEDKRLADKKLHFHIDLSCNNSSVSAGQCYLASHFLKISETLMKMNTDTSIGN